MTDQPIPVSDAIAALVREIEVCDKATSGPWFVADDDAKDCSSHTNSGLALVDTGRESDWPIARLMEWDNAPLIVHARNGYRAALEYLWLELVLYRRQCGDDIPDHISLYAAVAPIVARWREEDKR